MINSHIRLLWKSDLRCVTYILESTGLRVCQLIDKFKLGKSKIFNKQTSRSLFQGHFLIKSSALWVTRASSDCKNKHLVGAYMLTELSTVGTGCFKNGTDRIFLQESQ